MNACGCSALLYPYKGRQFLQEAKQGGSQTGKERLRVRRESYKHLSKFENTYVFSTKRDWQYTRNKKTATMEKRNIEKNLITVR